MVNIPPVLIVRSEAAQSEKISEIVRSLGLDPVVCTSLMDARTMVERQIFHIVLCDDELPDCNLRTSVSVLAASTGGVPVIVLSHLADWDAFVRALGAGAFDYIVCPPEPVEAERILRLALKQNSATHRPPARPRDRPNLMFPRD